MKGYSFNNFKLKRGVLETVLEERLNGINLLALIRLNIGREFYIKNKGRNLAKPFEVLLPSLRREAWKLAL